MKIIKITPWAEVVQEQRDLLRKLTEDLSQVKQKIREYTLMIYDLTFRLDRRRNQIDPLLANGVEACIGYADSVVDALREKKRHLKDKIRDVKAFLSREDY